MNSINNSSYVAPVAKTVVLGNNAILCNSQDPQSRTSAIDLGDYKTYDGKDTRSDF